MSNLKALSKCMIGPQKYPTIRLTTKIGGTRSIEITDDTTVDGLFDQVGLEWEPKCEVRLNGCRIRIDAMLKNGDDLEIIWPHDRDSFPEMVRREQTRKQSVFDPTDTDINPL